MAHPGDLEAIGPAADGDTDAFLRYLDSEDVKEEPAQDAEDIHGDLAPSDDDGAAYGSEEEETGPEEPDEDHPAEPVIEPPHSWSKADKEYFQSLPIEVQKIISEREKQRDTFLSQRAETLAQERKAIEVKQAEIEQIRNEYASRLEELQKLAWDDVPQPDESLIETDPVEYLRQRNIYERAQAHKTRIEQERARLAQEAEQKQAQQYQQYVAEQAKILEEAIPEYRDPEKRPQFQKDVAQYALSIGYTPEQLRWASASDIVTLNKARLYDAMQNARKAVPNKLKDLPKVTKPGQPQSRAERQAQARKADLERLKKTGRIDDAVSLLKDFL